MATFVSGEVYQVTVPFKFTDERDVQRKLEVDDILYVVESSNGNVKFMSSKFSVLLVGHQYDSDSSHDVFWKEHLKLVAATKE